MMIAMCSADFVRRYRESQGESVTLEQVIADLQANPLVTGYGLGPYTIHDEIRDGDCTQLEPVDTSH